MTAVHEAILTVVMSVIVAQKSMTLVKLLRDRAVLMLLSASRCLCNAGRRLNEASIAETFILIVAVTVWIGCRVVLTFLVNAVSGGLTPGTI